MFNEFRFRILEEEGSGDRLGIRSNLLGRSIIGMQLGAHLPVFFFYLIGQVS